MDERDLQAVSELTDLCILDEHDPQARSLIADASADVIAEAADMVRLYELLHRSEYEAVAGVRFREAAPNSMRIYFRLLDRDD